MDPHILGTIVAGVFGLMIGSFLNVLIYRLPRNESIVFPGSHCPACGASIRFYDNIPLISYMLLRGKCRSCRASISPIYPAIELFTGLMFARLFFLQGPTIHFCANLCFGSILIVATMTDFNTMLIPNRLTYPAMAIAAAFALRWGVLGIIRGGLGILAGFAILGFMYVLGKLLFKREGIGMGDFKLAVVIGLFAGAYWTFVILGIAIILGGTWGVGQIVAGKFRSGQEIPFGPFISMGGLLVLLFRYEINELIFLWQNMLG